jgi:hypothetical protein
LTDLEFRLNPEGVRQKSGIELMRELAEEARKHLDERARRQELENVSDRESQPAADVDE